MRRHHLVLLVSLLLAAPVYGQAQRAPISTDRPGFGNGSSVVGFKTVQVEGGYVFSDLEGGDQHTIGQMLLRFGIGESVELRGLVNSYVVRTVGGETASGLNDAGIGIKWNMIEGDDEPRGAPNISGIVDVTLATGADAFTEDFTLASFGGVIDWKLGEVVGISASGGYLFSPSGEQDVDNEIFLYGSLNADVPGTGLGLFGGVYGILPTEADEQYGVDGGVTYVFGRNTQVDVNVGFGLTDGQPDTMIGVGLAHRF